MKKRILAFLSVLLLLLLSFPMSVFATESSSQLCSDTNIETDLSKTTIEEDFANTFGGAFDVDEYIAKRGQLQLKLITMTEYVNSDGKIELYLYVYNPAMLKIMLQDETNKVTMSIEEGTACFDNFDKFTLEKIDDMHFTTSLKEYTNASLIKFKVNTSFTSEAKQRSYCISEIELQERVKLSSHSIGSKFIFTEQDNGTYEVFTESSDVFSIYEVNHTFYKVQSSNPYVTNDIRSVYFAVDKEKVDTYGMLDSVKVYWEELALKPILLVDNENVAKSFKEILGEKPADTFPYSFGSLLTPGVVNVGRLTIGHIGTKFDYGFNISKFPSRFYDGTNKFGSSIIEDTIWAQHYHNIISKSQAFKKVLDKLYFVQYCELESYVPGEDILKQADMYDGRSDGKYSLDICTSSNFYAETFDIYETENLFEYRVATNFLDYLLNGFRLSKESEYIKFNNFEAFNFDDLDLSDEKLSQKYLIDSNDVEEFRTFADKNDDCYIYFLRYSITQTRTTEASVFGNSTIKTVWGEEIPCYVCNASLVETTLINDYDTIQLGFKDIKGNYTVIPVSSEPIDSVVDIEHIDRDVPEPEEEKFDWLGLIGTIATVLCIIVAIVFITIISIIVLIILTIIKIFKKRGKKNEKKNN